MLNYLRSHIRAVVISSAVVVVALVTTTVALVEELGADTYVYGNVRTTDGGVDLVARSRGFSAPAIGSMVRVSPDRTYVFDTAGEQPRIS